MYLHLGQGDTTEEEKTLARKLGVENKFVLWETKRGEKIPYCF